MFNDETTKYNSWNGQSRNVKRHARQNTTTTKKIEPISIRLWIRCYLKKKNASFFLYNVSLCVCAFLYLSSLITCDFLESLSIATWQLSAIFDRLSDSQTMLAYHLPSIVCGTIIIFFWNSLGFRLFDVGSIVVVSIILCIFFFIY